MSPEDRALLLGALQENRDAIETLIEVRRLMREVVRLVSASIDARAQHRDALTAELEPSEGETDGHD